MKKIISFSLYGNKKKYTLGAIRNIILQKEIYPDWVCRIYYDSRVPKNILNELKKHGAELIDKTKDNPKKQEFWRFEPAFDKEIDVFIVRDADSRLNLREKYAVDEWLNSKYPVHIMRDHNHHNATIMGGMWGGKGGFIENFEELYNYFTNNMKPTHMRGDDIYFYNDQFFLRNIIWNLIKNNHYANDSVYNFSPKHLTHPFTYKLPNNRFVGQIVEIDNNNDDVYIFPTHIRK